MRARLPLALSASAALMAAPASFAQPATNGATAPYDTENTLVMLCPTGAMFGLGWVGNVPQTETNAQLFWRCGEDTPLLAEHHRTSSVVTPLRDGRHSITVAIQNNDRSGVCMVHAVMGRPTATEAGLSAPVHASFSFTTRAQMAAGGQVRPERVADPYQLPVAAGTCIGDMQEITQDVASSVLEQMQPPAPLQLPRDMGLTAA